MEGFPQEYRVSPLHILIGSSIPVCTETPVRRRKYPAGRRELFSLRKKRIAGIRPSAWQKAGSLYRLNPTPFPPFKNYGFQGDLTPWRKARRVKAVGLDP